jgi:serine/threonine-protein kinase
MRRQVERLPGTVVRDARYAVDGLLGSGYFADVFAIRELLTGAEWAAKVYPARSASKAAASREIDALTMLSHPRMPSLHEWFEEAGLTWVIMDLVPGPDLRADVDARGPLGVPGALRLGAETCELLGYCHSRGWTYRDLHPRNVHHLTPRGVAVVDFDGARRPGAPGDSGGRVGYRAPEVASSAKVDPACDVFALTGKDPPAEPGRSPLIRAALGLSPAAMDVLERCRNADPNARPSTALLRMALLEEIAR